MKQTSKKSRIIKVMAVALAFCLTMGIAQKTVMAATYDYTSFPTIFNGGSGIPSSATHIEQTVTVLSNAAQYAYAKCTEYSYTGSMPVLTVNSASTTYPTDSVSFTGTVTNKMKYTTSIPVKGKSIQFEGKVANYSTYFTIVAAVKG